MLILQRNSLGGFPYLAILFIFATNLIPVTKGSEMFVSSWNRSLGAPISASPVLHDLDGDSKKEVLISSLDGNVYVLNSLGEPLSGWPQETFLFQRVTPSVGDLDGDGSLEVVVGDDIGKLHAWNIKGEAVNGFPIQLEGSIKSVVRLKDVTGDGKSEILVHTGSSLLYLLDSEGRNLPGWPMDLGGDSDAFGSWTIASTPTWVDLDSDGVMEIAVGTTHDDVQVFRLDGTPVFGWPAETGDWVYPSVIPIDLDSDGIEELVTAAGDGTLYAWSADGENMPGFPIDIGSPIIGSVAAGEIDSINGLDIVVVGLNGDVHCFSGSSKRIAGWPQAIGADVMGSPILVDVNNDGDLDVIVPSRDNSLHAWNRKGEPIAELKLGASDWIDSTPAVADIDGDSKLDLVYASYDGTVYCVQLATPVSQSALQWPSFLGIGQGGFTDIDQDRMPDAFEIEFFKDLKQGADDDYDGDGSSNRDEWIAGTNPIQRDHIAVNISMGDRVNDSEVILRWTGLADRSYRILASDSLDINPANWSTVSESILVSSQQIIEVSVLLNEANPSRFFRVAVSLN